MILRLRGENVRFADTIDPFKNHGACSSVPWINKILSTAPYYEEWMHPNANGYQGYATAVTTVLRTDPMRCSLRGCAIRFQDESVYYSLTQPAPVAQIVKGSIRTAYEAEGAEQGWLGYPKTDERPEPANGQSQVFEGGTYWWRSGAGAFPVRGAFLTKYAAVGDVTMIGTPMGKDFAVTGGRVQYFSSGWMFLKSGGTQAFYSKGAILAKYREENATAGILAWPRTDVICGLPDGACRQDFDGSGSRGSAVYWTSTTGAHKVVGRIYEFYLDIGGPTGDITDTGNPPGYPDTDQAEAVSAEDGKMTVQFFQRGSSIVVFWEAPRTRCYFPTDVNGRVCFAF